MIGVYKITSPNNRVYIGQSIDLDKRFDEYDKLENCKKQIRLYNSFLKYGVEKHKFEIIELCNEFDLNYWERYYQDLYDVINKQGLNCKLTTTKDKSGQLSDETKLKIRNNKTNYKHSDEIKLKLSGPRRNYSKLNIEDLQKINIETKQRRRIIDIETGVIYNSIRVASLVKGLNYGRVRIVLSTNRPNYTGLEYYYGE